MAEKRPLAIPVSWLLKHLPQHHKIEYSDDTETTTVNILDYACECVLLNWIQENGYTMKELIEEQKEIT